MKTISSIQFYYYHQKLILLHFEIETFEFTRFKYPFITDKYPTILQYEELYNRIHEVLREVTNQKNWRNCKTQGKMRVSELFVEYNLLDKNESLVNFEKINYEFDWFMKIEIKRRPPKKTNNNEPSQSSSIKSNDSEPKIVNNKNSDTVLALSDTTVIQLSDNLDENNSNNTIKLEDSETSDQENDEFITHRQNKRPKLESSFKENKTKKSNEKNKKQQIFMSGWLNSSGEVGKSSNHTKTVSKRKEVSSTSMDLKTGDNVVADIMNEENRQKFQNFIEKSKENYSKKEVRKQELKDYQVLHCKHLTNDEIKGTVKSMKELISEKYEEIRCFNELTFGDGQTPSFLVTTLGILSEKQNLLVLGEIEKICETFDDRLPREDDVVHDVIFPFVLIEIFKKVHNFTTDEAMARIKIQDEYNQYYSKGDTSL